VYCADAAGLAGWPPVLPEPLIAQKYIPGRSGVTEMLCAAGRPLAWLSSYVTQRRDGPFSSSTARRFQAVPALQSLVERLAQLTQFDGFCGFDWVEAADTGRHYLIEFHPRPTCGIRFGRACGVDFPAAIQAWLAGRADSFVPRTQPPGHTLSARFFSCDLLRCWRRRDWAGLRAWLPGSGTRHDLFWDDLPLLAGWGLRRGGRWLKRKLGAGGH
jgi:hypothetical protein